MGTPKFWHPSDASGLFPEVIKLLRQIIRCAAL